MTMKPEDRPKLIGLAVALVGVVAYILFGILPKLSNPQQTNTSTPPVQPAVQTENPQAAAANPPGVTGGSGSSPLSDGTDLDKGDIPVPKRDSFKPPIAAAMPAKASGPSVPTTPLGPGLAPPTAPAVTSGGTTVPAAGPAPILIAEPPLPAVELKGVILGEPAIAVLSINGEVFQKMEGDHLGGMLVLTKISEGGIMIQHGKKTVPVTVGHTMPGSRPENQTALAPR